jgi:hypothetical protein
MGSSRSVGIIAAHHLFAGTAQFSYYCVNRRPLSCGRGGCVRADLDNRQKQGSGFPFFSATKQKPHGFYAWRLEPGARLVGMALLCVHALYAFVFAS